jgi:hypothetical protein
MDIKPEMLAVLGTLVGALIGSLSTLLITWLNKKSDERKHLRELVVNAAIESWKQHVSAAVAKNISVAIMPLDTYIIHMIKFSELILDKEINASNIEKKLAEITEVVNKAEEYKRRISLKPER